MKERRCPGALRVLFSWMIRCMMIRAPLGEFDAEIRVIHELQTQFKHVVVLLVLLLLDRGIQEPLVVGLTHVGPLLQLLDEDRFKQLHQVG